MSGSDRLALGLAIIAVLGTLAGAFVGMLTARSIESKRQEFEREQAERAEREHTMKTGRVLDSDLMEAQALLTKFVVKDKRLWPDHLSAPDATVWLELRGTIAVVVEPADWITLNVGFLAVRHMQDFWVGYRELGMDETTPLDSKAQEVFRPVLDDIVSARQALHPVAYPNHVRVARDANDDPDAH